PTAEGVGADAVADRRLVGGVVDLWPRIERLVLGPASLPRHPFSAARFGVSALQSADRLAQRSFSTERARALLGGIAAHGMLPIDKVPSCAIGLVLAALAHTVGWPIPLGGAQRLADALASHLRSLGSEIVTGTPVTALED